MKIICVTNRTLCRDAFEVRLERIAQQHPDRIVLREKDLSVPDYRALFIRCKKICDSYKVPLVLHSHISIAKEQRSSHVHVPMQTFLHSQKQLIGLNQVGVSVHSAKEAQTAQQLGARYLIAGHIYPTDCKKGLPARGLQFLKEITDAVSIPVYAIGGITPENLQAIKEAGASGFCIMSPLMMCDSPKQCVKQYRAYMP